MESVKDLLCLAQRLQKLQVAQLEQSGPHKLLYLKKPVPDGPISQNFPDSSVASSKLKETASYPHVPHTTSYHRSLRDTGSECNFRDPNFLIYFPH